MPQISLKRFYSKLIIVKIGYFFVINGNRELTQENIGALHKNEHEKTWTINEKRE